MRRLLRAFIHGIREARDGLWRNPALSLLSSLSIGAAIYVVGLFFLIAFNLGGYVDTLGRDVQVQVYLKEGVSPDAIRALRDELGTDPAVEEVRYVSREEAQRRFRETFPTLKDLSETVRGNPFPASFELTIRASARDPAALEAFADHYEGARGVEEIRYDLGWIERLAGVVRLVRSGGFGLGAVLALAMMVTVGAVVRLTVLARREEIEIMKLVGATAAFIRGPFLLGAAVQGITGGGIAIGALLLTHHLVGASELARGSPFLAVVFGSFLPVGATVWLASSGAALGLVAAALALRRAGSY